MITRNMRLEIRENILPFDSNLQSADAGWICFGLGAGVA